ncbi:MAG: pyruvate kinase [Hyphomonas sp.]|nr:pyruvate kinase [Hyphomonas sp.]
MPRRTKIVATLGPATDDPDIIDRLIDAGVDVVRINLSHGSHEEHAKRADHVRNRARACGRQVGVLVDLQGPKIRCGGFSDGPVQLAEGDTFTLDVDYPIDQGNQEIVGCTYKQLPTDLNRGDTLMVNDGKIVLWVDQVDGSKVICKVKVGGELSDNKGINKQGGGLSAPALTEKDVSDIAFAAEIEADYLAVSFVRSAEDIHRAREMLTEADGRAAIVAKVERAEAIEAIDEIIDATDVIMVARGDLGVELGDAELPAVQKMLIRRTRAKNKVVITATQMMESMIENPIPTRAEVFDVANAVLDGTDAVMLSGETAVGRHPAKVIQSMARICVEAEKQVTAKQSSHRLHTEFGRVDEAIAMASMYTANHLGVAAIASLTESGSTALWMSRISSGIPIYAMTEHVATRRRVTLYRGVYPISFQPTESDSQRINQEVVEELLRRGAVRDGDLVIITKGDFQGIPGGTNVMKILRVGEHILPD